MAREILDDGTSLVGSSGGTHPGGLDAGHALEQYRTQKLLSHEGLAVELGCSVEILHWLSLCRRPTGVVHAQQLATIAARFCVSAEKLESLLGKVAG
ncbi:hypothetical protein ACN28E_54980 [Archangium lansingense]|uniref:hypothetical protein n=1 Tax=Archangium lansingense TaxID=2995310 RepID=UPI003B7C8266